MRQWLLERWHLLRCRLKKHDDVLYFVGLNVGKECRWCQRPGIMNEEEFRIAQETKVGSWRRDAVVEEED